MSDVQYEHRFKNQIIKIEFWGHEDGKKIFIVDHYYPTGISSKVVTEEDISHLIKELTEVS